VSDPWKRFRPRRKFWLRVLATQFALLLAGAVTIGAFTAWVQRLRAAEAERPPAAEEVLAELEALDRRLQETRGELEVTRLQLDRATNILKYSAAYQIPADLSESIYDVAVAEGIHPSVGYQLVKVESGFRISARSHKGAIGYTQVRLPTARAYDPDITERQLAERETNLRIGFRFLKDLLKRFDNHLPTALLAYNRGPTLVDSILTSGGDPANGYAKVVLGGLKRPARGAPRGS
jgi:soluble lytic murein transglycosylase-like protein